MSADENPLSFVGGILYFIQRCSSDEGNTGRPFS